MNERTSTYQGLRIILLLFVILHHLQCTLVNINLVMTFFFVLSGFLYKGTTDVKSYYWKKTKTIFPLYWLTLLIAIVINHLHIVKGIVPHLLLLQSFVPSSDETHFYFRYVGVAWFLSSLMFCYLMSPWLYRILQNKKKGITVSMLCSSLCLIAVFITCSNHEKYVDFKNWIFYINPIVRCLEYFCGMSLGVLIKNMKYREIKYANILGVIFIVMLAWALVARGALMNYFLVLINLLLISIIYLYNLPVVKVLFGNKVMVYLASLLMPVYLIHQVLIICCEQYTRNYWVIGSIIIPLSFVYALLWNNIVVPKINAYSRK